REMGHAAVVKDEVTPQFGERDGQRMADDAARIEVESREASVDGWIVVLNTGGNAQEASLDVPHEGDQVIAVDGSASERREGADESDGKGGGSPKSRAARRLGAGHDLKAAQLEVLERLADQGHPLIGEQFRERRVAAMDAGIG